jgi:hypothetical protein
VCISDVTDRSSVPTRVMTATHIAASHAAMKAGPLTMPPGRSRTRRKGTRTVHCPSAADSSRNP